MLKNELQFYVNFFDAFDGAGEVGFHTDRIFNTIQEATEYKDKLMAALPEENKEMGEKYYIVDTRKTKNTILKEKLEQLITQNNG